jgi:tRNA A-37 threonylcarbamoyl transferase component Bud32
MPADHNSGPLGLTTVYDRHERLLEAFEAAWQRGEQPAIEDYLPAGHELDLLADFVRADLECRLKAGQAARIEDYLAPYAALGSDQDLLLDLIAAEFALRRRSEPELSAQEYIKRFPSLATELAGRLREQLAHDQSLASTINETKASPAPEAGALPTGTQPGPRYRAFRFHAKGALGEVHVAEDGELHREVAVKRIQPRYAHDEDARQRFLREAEITARLEHSGVVPVYGLVHDADGQPTYAMRFIQGETLQDAIERFHGADKPGRDPAERNLEFRQLLSRFIAVCNTVAYAHSRGIIHRDLKPANIMIGKYGETLVVDWGLAKPVERDETAKAGGEKTLMPSSASDGTGTHQDALIGTPAFMSPEQAARQADRVGPASDIYCLGATLYVLLTGKAAFEGDVFEILLAVQRGDFPRPRQRKREVPPALEAICLKAMAPKPEDRYSSAADLAADVEHWLADEPIATYREPFSVRCGRWVRRHRAVSAVAIVLLLATTAGLSAGFYFVNAEKNRTELARRDEAAQRKVAEQAAADAKAVLDFFQDQVLAAARPESQEGGLGIHATIRAAVDAAEPKIAGAFHDRPLVEASIRNTLGGTYWYLREDKAAIKQFERGLELRRDQLGPDHPDTLECMNNLATAHQAAGQLDKALPLLEQTLAKFKEQLGPDHPHTLANMNNLARAYQHAGQLAKALPLFEQVLAKRKEQLGPDHPNTLLSMNNLGMAYKDACQLDKALPLLEQTLMMFKEQLGRDHPNTLTSINNLGFAYQAAGQFHKALPLFEQTLAKQKENLGSDHPDTLLSMSNLAMAYQALGQLDKALPLLEETLAKRKEKLGTDHPDTLMSMNNLANAYQALGQLDKALPLFEQTLAKRKKKLGSDHPDTLGSMNNLALAYWAAGQQDKALPLFEQTQAKFQEKLGPHHPDTLLSMNNLAGAYKAAGQFDKALPLYEQTLAKRKEKLGPHHPDTLTSMNDLANAYQGLGQLDKALPLYEQTLAKRKERLGPHHPDTLISMSNLAGAYQKNGCFAKAELILRECLTICQKKQPDLWTTFLTQSQLGGSLLCQQNYGEAEPLLLAGYEGMKQREAQIPTPAKKYLTKSLERLVQLYDAWDKPEQAEEWRQRLEQPKAAAKDSTK